MRDKLLIVVLLLTVSTPLAFSQQGGIKSTSARRIFFGTTANLPATCNPGDVYFKTDASVGTNLVACTAGNVWTAVGTGSSGGTTSFANITTGTNTAGLVVGTGGTLQTSGTGQILATSVARLTIPASATLTTAGNFNLTLTATADTNSTFPAGTHNLAPLDSPSFTTPSLGDALANTLGVGPSNTSLGTVTASFLDRTAATGATSVYVGSDNNSHVSATTTRFIVQGGTTDPTNSTTLGSSTPVQFLKNDGTRTAGIDPQKGNMYGNAFLDTQSGLALDYNAAGNLALRDTEYVSWTNAANYTSGPDTSVSRISAALVAVGNGTQGDFTGTLKLTPPGASAGDIPMCLSTGNIVHTAAATCGTSAARYKQDIEALAHGLDWVMKMRPVTYQYRPEFVSDRTPLIGFVADDMLQINPLLAVVENGAVMNYRDRAVVAALVKSVQELEQQIQQIQQLRARK